MKSQYEEGDKVEIVRPDDRIKYSRIEYAFVIGHTDEGQPVVEFNFKLAKHIDVFKDEELKPYE